MRVLDTTCLFDLFDQRNSRPTSSLDSGGPQIGTCHEARRQERERARHETRRHERERERESFIRNDPITGGPCQQGSLGEVEGFNACWLTPSIYNIIKSQRPLALYSDAKALTFEGKKISKVSTH